MTPRVMTGTATYARGLIRELARSNISVEPVAIVNELMRSEVARWTDDSLKMIELRSIRARNTSAGRRALLTQALLLPGTLVRQLPQDIDVMHYPLTLPLPRAQPPIVVTLHDVQHHDQPQLFSRLQHKWRRYIYDAPARAAALVITDSEHAKGRIIDTLGIAPDRVDAIHLGIDHDLFHPAESDDRAMLDGLGLPDRFILYPAGIWPHKNHKCLIDALALIEDREVSSDPHGPTFGALGGVVQRARLRGVEDRVMHLGFVSSRQLAALYRAAEALVFPSLYEGFGAPPLEAMACGCPVATSVEGSLGEVCGRAAALFDPRSPNRSLTSSMPCYVIRICGETPRTWPQPGG